MKNRTTTLLALLAANDLLGQPEVHRTMLVKQVFLAEIIRPLYRIWRKFFSFVRYNYGPFSEDIFSSLDILIFNGLVEVTYFEQRGNRVKARYRITPAGHAELNKVEAGDIIELANDLVWALQTLGVDQSTKICKIVYQEAEFARIFALHTQEGIGPESRILIPAITDASNDTFVTLSTLQILMQYFSQDSRGGIKYIAPTKEVVRMFLTFLVMKVPHKTSKKAIR